MKTLIRLVLISFVLAVGVSARTTYNFNSDWRLFVGDVKGSENPAFDDSTWKTVTTPNAWNEDDAFKKDIVDLSTGIAWYRKHFKLPANSSKKKVFLEFEGIRQAGEFYLNGKFIGLHENGITAIGYDISDMLNEGENVIAVRINNDWDYKEKSSGEKFQWNDRNFNANYGGINKNVWLHISEKIYQTLPLYTNLGTTGVYVYASDFDIKNKSAKITAESEVKNESETAKNITYEVTIKELNGKIIKKLNGEKFTIQPNEIKKISAYAFVKNLEFWSWGYGYLYDVVTTLKIDNKDVDSVTTRTGFRKTEFANGLVQIK